MKAVVHARSQPQGDEVALLKRAQIHRGPDEVLQSVWHPFGLKHEPFADHTVGPHDGITWAAQYIRPSINRPRPGFELTGETGVD